MYSFHEIHVRMAHVETYMTSRSILATEDRRRLDGLERRTAVFWKRGWKYVVAISALLVILGAGLARRSIVEARAVETAKATARTILGSIQPYESWLTGRQATVHRDFMVAVCLGVMGIACAVTYIVLRHGDAQIVTGWRNVRGLEGPAGHGLSMQAGKCAGDGVVSGEVKKPSVWEWVVGLYAVLPILAFPLMFAFDVIASALASNVHWYYYYRVLFGGYPVDYRYTTEFVFSVDRALFSLFFAVYALIVVPSIIRSLTWKRRLRFRLSAESGRLIRMRESQLQEEDEASRLAGN